MCKALKISPIWICTLKIVAICKGAPQTRHLAWVARMFGYCLFENGGLAFYVAFEVKGRSKINPCVEVFRFGLRHLRKRFCGLVVLKKLVLHLPKPEECKMTIGGSKLNSALIGRRRLGIFPEL